MADVAWANFSTRNTSISGAETIADLWGARGRFEDEDLTDLPPAAQAYLRHAIAPGAVLASSVKLHMHGHIKMKRWHRFTATEIIHRDREYAWQARSSIFGVPVYGFDGLLGGKSSAHWRAFGFLPLSGSSGGAKTRSATGRAIAESVWLPSSLCSGNVRWTALTERNPHAYIVANDRWAALELSIDDAGALKSFSVMRWGLAGGESYHYHPFGAIVEAEGTFNGYTIPTQLRMGYFVGTPHFERHGEFLRVTIDSAAFV